MPDLAALRAKFERLQGGTPDRDAPRSPPKRTVQTPKRDTQPSVSEKSFLFIGSMRLGHSGILV